MVRKFRWLSLIQPSESWRMLVCVMAGTIIIALG
jgi:hypothetical protein